MISSDLRDKFQGDTYVQYFWYTYYWTVLMVCDLQQQIFYRYVCIYLIKRFHKLITMLWCKMYNYSSSIIISISAWYWFWCLWHQNVLPASMQVLVGALLASNMGTRGCFTCESPHTGGRCTRDFCMHLHQSWLRISTHLNSLYS